MKSLAKLIGVGLMALALPLAALAAGEKSKNLNIDVPNLTSANAEAQVQSALGAIDGVEIKQVNAKSGTVHVMIDPEKVSPEAVISAIKAAGYEAKVHVEKTSG